jgi:8-oxo-dGTP pyrophosphatase MutT (NUDIX family)
MSELDLELKAVMKHELCFERNHLIVEDMKMAAVLALFRGHRFLESEILLILRSPDLVQNPGQVALPGGALDAEDERNFVRAALRETFEEVGLYSDSIEVYGVLPPMPTVTGGFLVNPVLGRFTGTKVAPLQLQETEVSEASWVKVADLIASRETERRVVQGVEMELPVYYWKENRMWGLTAMIFDLICRRYDKLFS